MRTITTTELAAHGPQSQEPWVAIDGEVYDMSKFAKFHPGGKGVLLRACGADASKDFTMMHHPSVLANEKYRKLCVGQLEGSKTKLPSFPASYTDHYWLTGLNCPSFITDKHRAWQKRLREYYEKEIIPHAGQWDEKGTWPIELHRKAYEAGGYGAPWPVAYGGTPPEGWDWFMAFITYYETARVPSNGWQASFASIHITLPPILKFGSEELKEKYGRPLIEGTKVGSLCITEPWAGSDVTGIRTTAEKKGDHYIINGEKKFITSGMRSHIFTLAARTAPPTKKSPFYGVSLFVVEADSEGIDRRRIPTQGWWGSSTAYITFENVKVPKANLIGKENEGFKYIMSNFNTERFMMASGSLAFCHLLIGESIRFAKVRETFGKSLIHNPVIRQKIADMAMKTEALYAMCEQTAYLLETKVPDVDIAPRIALGKVYSTQTYDLCAREASQIFGGNSYVRGGQGAIVERLYRDVRVQAIAGGSEEILKDLGIRMSKL